MLPISSCSRPKFDFAEKILLYKSSLLLMRTCPSILRRKRKVFERFLKLVSPRVRFQNRKQSRYIRKNYDLRLRKYLVLCWISVNYANKNREKSLRCQECSNDGKVGCSLCFHALQVRYAMIYVLKCFVWDMFWARGKIIIIISP